MADSTDDLDPGANESKAAANGMSPHDDSAAKPDGSAKAKAAPKAQATTGGTAGAAPKKKVVSKRVTPKGGPVPGAQKSGSTAAHAHAPDGHDAGYSSRYTPPTAKYAQGPSPMWVPVLMFALLGLGSLLIIANYARLFGEPENWRLLVGLGAILGGIITATNLR